MVFLLIAVLLVGQTGTTYGNDFPDERLYIPWEVLASDCFWDYEEPFTYDGTAHSVNLTIYEDVRIVAMSNNTATNAGKYTATATLEVAAENIDTDAPTYDVSIEWEIQKGTYDLSQVKWDYTGEPFTEDGTTKTVKLTGLPNSVEITYQSNSASKAGTYTATAAIGNYDTVNYVAPTLDASLETLSWMIEKGEEEPSSQTPSEKETERETEAETSSEEESTEEESSIQQSTEEDFPDMEFLDSVSKLLKSTRADGVVGDWNYSQVTGTWSFAERNNNAPVSGWMKVVNPFAAGDQPKASWFYFDEQGTMLTGWQWIKDADGITRCYYLNPVKNGIMETAWLDYQTPYGYQVNKSGEWTQSGIVQTR